MCLVKYLQPFNSFLLFTALSFEGNTDLRVLAFDDITIPVNLRIGSFITVQTQWYYEGQPLISDGNYTIIDSFPSNGTMGSSTLLLTDLPPDEAGMYTFQVISEAKVEEISFNVTIRG